MSATALSQPITAGFQESYYDKGYYLCRITKPKLNARGEPCLTLNVVQSFDNRRINSFYCINFFLKSQSDKQRILWSQKIQELIRATRLDKLEDMTQLDELEVTVYFSRAGYSPLPTFLESKVFEKSTSNVQPISYNQKQNIAPEESRFVNEGIDVDEWLESVPFPED